MNKETKCLKHYTFGRNNRLFKTENCYAVKPEELTEVDCRYCLYVGYLWSKGSETQN